MRRIRLVKEQVEYCQSTTDKMTMGDLVTTWSLACTWSSSALKMGMCTEA